MIFTGHCILADCAPPMSVHARQGTVLSGTYRLAAHHFNVQLGSTYGVATCINLVKVIYVIDKDLETNRNAI